MGSQPLNQCNVSLTSGMCFSVKGGRYAPTSWVRVGPVTISQLTTLGPWKRVNSIPPPPGYSLVIRPMPPWYPLTLDERAFGHAKLYPRQLWEYAYVWIFVSIRSITSNSLYSTARMAFAIPKLLPSRMFSVPISSPGGIQGRRRGGGGSVCRRSEPWRIGWEKVSGILVGNKRTKKEGKTPYWLL